MTYNFHSAECALRHDGVECTCGYVKPLSQKEKQMEELRQMVVNARIVARAYLYEAGVDGAPQPELPTSEIADLAFSLLTDNLITRVKGLGLKK